MTNITTARAKLLFRQRALEKLYDAYLALVEGGVKSYRIDDRELTRFDLPALKKEITALEQEISELERLITGKSARKAVGIVPRDW